MKKIILTILNSIFVAFSFSQSIDWLTEIKGQSFEEIKGTTVSKNGDTYITGYIDETYAAQFGNITIPYIYGPREHYITAKCDSAGNFIWVKTGGSYLKNRGASITLDDNKNVYTTGYCEGNSAFDDLIIKMTPNVEKSILVKYDANGRIKWGVRFGGNGYYDDASGECLRYMNGYLYDFARRRTVDPITVFNQTVNQFANKSVLSYLAKFDTAGNFISVKAIAGSTEANLVIRDVVPVDENLIVTGFFNNDLAIDTINCKIPYDKYQSFIVKYNASGDLLWFRKLSSSNSTNFILAIDVDSEKNTLATGIYIDSLTVDNTTLIKESATNYNSFLCKMDSNGVLLWMKNIEGQGDITSTGLSHTENRIYISGSYYGNLQTDNFALSSPNGYNLFVLEYDKSGNIIQGNSYGKTNYLEVNDMGISDIGDLYITGQYLNSTVIGPYHLFADSSYLLDNYPDGFIFKYDPNGKTNSISHLKNKQEAVNIYPNPSNGVINIEITGFKSNNKKTIQIFNAYGIKMREFVIPEQSTTLNCCDLVPGIYFLRIIDGQNVYKQNLIIDSR